MRNPGPGDLTILPKNRRGGNNFQLILWDQDYSDTKTRKDIMRNENYRSVSLMNINTKIFNKYYHTEPGNMWKGLYVTTKWDLSKDC